MSGIGDYLKQVRQQRGYSLEEVNRITNIHIKYLHALENDRFDLLPSPFYAKAFLRTYAKSLGVDTKPLLDHFDKLMKMRPNSGTVQSHAPQTGIPDKYVAEIKREFSSSERTSAKSETKRAVERESVPPAKQPGA